ncbi:MAG: hypothetical protein ACLFU2_04600 [Opitutales bacterium]
MAHQRKDTLTKPREWWRHLRWMKRLQNKGERVAARDEIARMHSEAHVEGRSR